MDNSIQKKASMLAFAVLTSIALMAVVVLAAIKAPYISAGDVRNTLIIAAGVQIFLTIGSVATGLLLGVEIGIEMSEGNKEVK